MLLRITALIALSTLTFSALAEEGDPSIQHLFPIPEETRQIIEQRCVLCHGEVIDGEAEIREDLNLSSEEAIRATLYDLEVMIEMIEEDEMPHEAKLSFRLRRDPEMQRRLREIKSAYEEKGEKEKLLAWLRSKSE